MSVRDDAISAHGGGELVDLKAVAGERFLVEALHVALDEFVDRASHEHFEEALVLVAHFVANVAIGRDRRGDRDDAVAREQVAYVADPPDIDVAILFGKTESLGEIGADFVAVENLDAMRAFTEFLGDQIRKRGFSRSGKAGKPQGKALIHL